MNFNFTDKIALVTGASRGIGKEIAKMLADAGAQVVINYRANQAAAEETLATLSGQGHMIIQADMANPAALETMMRQMIEHFGRIDILVNNAGIYEEHPILETNFDEWQQAWYDTLATNLLGPAHLIWLAASQMTKQGGGRIVNVSSRGAFRGEPDSPAYGPAKQG